MHAPLRTSATPKMINSWLKARLVRSIFQTEVELPLLETTEIVTPLVGAELASFLRSGQAVISKEKHDNEAHRRVLAKATPRRALWPPGRQSVLGARPLPPAS